MPRTWAELIAEDDASPRRSRRAVPVAELLGMALDLQQQLADVPDGATVTFKVGP